MSLDHLPLAGRTMMIAFVRRRVVLSLLALAFVMPATALAQAPPKVRCIADLECLSWCELEQLYRQAQPGPIPCGFLRGRTFYAPDQFLGCFRERNTNRVWLGKHFWPEECKSLNQFCFGKIIRSQLSYGPSWLDGQPAIILDYRRSSLAWFDVRDEMRQIAPGLYLGGMFLERWHGPQQRLFFVLEEVPCQP